MERELRGWTVRWAALLVPIFAPLFLKKWEQLKKD